MGPFFPCAPLPRQIESPHLRTDVNYAWPTAEIAVMEPEGAGPSSPPHHRHILTRSIGVREDIAQVVQAPGDPARPPGCSLDGHRRLASSWFP